eukprot:UN24813
MDNQINRLEAVCARLESVARKMGAKGGDGDDEAVPEHVTEWLVLVKDVDGILALWKDEKFGYPAKFIGDLTGAIDNAFKNATAYITATGKCKKPQPADAMKFLQPIMDAVKVAEDLCRTRNKKLRKFDNVFKPLTEFLQSLYWLPMYPPQLPTQHTKNQMESFQLYQNRVKEDERKPAMKAMYQFLKKQCDFIKEQDLKMGLPWNPKGGDLSGASTSVEAPKAAAKEEKKEAPKEEKKKAPTGNIIADLNKGLSATAGLKKVKKSQKTKYRKERVGKVSMKTTKAKVKKNIKPPSNFKKRGFSWMFENNIEGVTTIGEDEERVTLKNGIFLADNFNCGFVIKRKIKSLSIATCKKIQIEVHDVVSSIELVNCSSVTIYCYGQLPSISIEKPIHQESY